MSSYRAVLFDLDGTICRRTDDASAAFHASFETVGVEPFGEPSALWPLLDGPPDPSDRVGYLATGFARLAAKHDRRVDPLALSTAFLDAIEEAAVEYVPGAERAISLAGASARTGLVTNGPRDRQELKVDALDLRERFGTFVYAGDLDRRKPHAEPFLRALDALDVAPEDAVYVGNSLAYDVAGAFTAGMDSVWLRSNPESDPEGYRPDWVLDSLEDFGTVLGVEDPDP